MELVHASIMNRTILQCAKGWVSYAYSKDEHITSL